MIVGIVGTTIAPWMQFYQQASVVEKGIPLKHYRYSRWDTIAGAIVVTIICYFIVMACAATLHRAGITIETAGDAAKALQPVAGNYCADIARMRGNADCHTWLLEHANGRRVESYAILGLDVEDSPDLDDVRR